MEPFVLRFEEETVGLEVDPLYVCNVTKVDGSGRGAGLERVKMRLSRHRVDCDMGRGIGR